MSSEGGHERLGDARSLPLGSRCNSARAHLALPSCDLIVQRTFPRIFEMNYKVNGLICLVPRSSEIEATVNGIASRGQSIMTIR